jgi:zinc protease
MRRTIIACTAAVLLAAAGCKDEKKAERERPEPADEPEARVEVLMIPAAVDAVDFRILFETGSVDDPEGKEGLTALTARLMAEGGTRSHSYPELLDLLYPMAAHIGVQVDKQMTVFTARVHRDHLERFVPLLAEVITAPRFDEEAFARLHTDAINDIEKGLRMTNDEQLALQALDVWLHEDHPYGHLVGGTVEGLESVTLADVEKHYGKVFTRDRLVVGLAGAVDEELSGRLREAFASLPERGAPQVEIPPPAGVEELAVRIIEKKTSSTVVAMGHPIDVHRDHDDYHALWLAQSALGEHRQCSGRLFKTIREKRGLNYGDYAYIEPYVRHGRTTKPTLNIARDRHAFQVWIRSVPNPNRLFAVKLAFWTLGRFVEQGMDDAELDRTRGFLMGYTRVFEESLDRRLGYALDDLFHGAEEPFLDRARERFGQATLAEVNAAAAEHLEPGRMKVVIVTEDGRALADQLVGAAAAEVHYHTPKPPEVLEEDESIVDLDLGLEEDDVDVVGVEEVFQR